MEEHRDEGAGQEVLPGKERCPEIADVAALQVAGVERRECGQFTGNGGVLEEEVSEEILLVGLDGEEHIGGGSDDQPGDNRPGESRVGVADWDQRLVPVAGAVIIGTMNIKELNEAIALLADLDPADVPDPADLIAEALAAQLEASEEPDGSAGG